MAKVKVGVMLMCYSRRGLHRAAVGQRRGRVDGDGRAVALAWMRPRFVRLLCRRWQLRSDIPVVLAPA